MTTTFERVTCGKWKNAETGWFIVLDEDYGKTYRAYHINRFGWTEHLRGKNGRQIGFRTFEGAVKAATKAYTAEREERIAEHDREYYEEEKRT